MPEQLNPESGVRKIRVRARLWFDLGTIVNTTGSMTMDQVANAVEDNFIQQVQTMIDRRQLHIRVDDIELMEVSD